MIYSIKKSICWPDREMRKEKKHVVKVKQNSICVMDGEIANKRNILCEFHICFDINKWGAYKGRKRMKKKSKRQWFKKRIEKGTFFEKNKLRGGESERERERERERGERDRERDER